jgi:hypothetical protein
MTIYVTSGTDVKVQYLTSNLSEVDVVVNGDTVPGGQTFPAGTKIPVTFELSSIVDTRRDGQIQLINEIGESMIIDIVVLPLLLILLSSVLFVESLDTELELVSVLESIIVVELVVAL